VNGTAASPMSTGSPNLGCGTLGYYTPGRGLHLSCTRTSLHADPLPWGDTTVQLLGRLDKCISHTRLIPHDVVGFTGPLHRRPVRCIMCCYCFT
jgi:hypothetical protein